jgi:mono/diheme cytochrome c family protein
MAVASLLWAVIFSQAPPVHAQDQVVMRDDDDVTFVDVAPIFWASCVQCHSADGGAPMSLLTYQDARRYARRIKEMVSTRQMPPWFVDRTIGIQDFQHNPSLTDEQIETVVRWVDAGAPAGDLNSLSTPEIASYQDRWRLEDHYGRPPDLVIRSPRYVVPAEGQDNWPTLYSAVEGLNEPRWVKAVEVKPASPETAYVFHHLNVQGESSLLSHSNVGKWYDLYPEDAGRLLLPGEELSWDAHYWPMGQEVDATMLLGVWLLPAGEEPELGEGREMIFSADPDHSPNHGIGRSPSSTYGTGVLRNQELLIPPGETFMLQGIHVLERPLRIHSMQIHMHQRGKALTVEAQYPDGRREVLNRLIHDHRWLPTYVYEEDARPLLPKGTVLFITAEWDNTTNNPNNPDPNQWVAFSRRTVDEMGHVWVGTTWLDDETYERLVAEREARLVTQAP